MTFSPEDFILNPGKALNYISTMKNKYLAMHRAPITQGKGKDRRWTTRVPDPTRKDGRKIIRKNTREEVEQEVILHYLKLEHHISTVSQVITINEYKC